MSVTKALRKMKGKKKKKEKPPKHYLGTGSTLLNLAISNRPNGGFGAGRYYFIVGDSSSGKTFVSMTCFAEACADAFFDKHRIIHDDVEDGALMDTVKFFGQAVADRIEPPAVDDEGLPIYSETIEDFYFHLDDVIEDGRPFIYVLDSMDALTSEQEKEKFGEQKKAARMNKKTAGSYGDGKAKKNSAGMRKLLKPLRKSDSILLVLNQTRDNIGFGPNPKTRSGGRALRFYATVEIWSSVVGRIKKAVRGKDRQVGINTKVKVKKNRQTGGEHEVTIPIYHSYGIDDVGSCVDYLVAEGHWPKTKQTIDAHDFDHKGTRDKVIAYIEDNDLEGDVREIVGEVWADIIKQSAIKRKRRYQ